MLDSPRYTHFGARKSRNSSYGNYPVHVISAGFSGVWICLLILFSFCVVVCLFSVGHCLEGPGLADSDEQFLFTGDTWGTVQISVWS